MLLKIFFNILIIYFIWNLLKMVFQVKKAQNRMEERFTQQEKRNPEFTEPKKSSGSKNEGEYIDFEEIK